MKMEITTMASDVLNRATDVAVKFKNKYLTPEHIVYALCDNVKFVDIFTKFGGNIDDLKENLESYFEDSEKNPNVTRKTLVETSYFKSVMNEAAKMSLGNQLEAITLNHIILSLLRLEDTYFMYYLDECIEESYNMMKAFAHTLMGDENEFGRIDTNDDEFLDDEEYDDNDEIVSQMFINGVPMGNMPPSFGQFLSSVMGINHPSIMGMKPNSNINPFENSKEKNKPVLKNLEKYGTCLNEKVFKPVIGREKEVELTCRTLARKDKCNPVHVGEPGVGKTAIVHALVQAIKRGDVPEQLKDAIIYEISLGELVAGTQYRGEFEERLKGIIKDALSNPNIILYIDEIHQLVGSGATGNGSMDGAQILKPYLNDGSLKCIGATTYAEYKKFIEKDSALQRRFKKIDVSEPTVDEAIQILAGLKETYEKHHNVTYEAEALETAVNLSHKFLTEKFLPDKAIDLIDEAGAYVNQKNLKGRTVTKELVQQVLAESCNIPAAQVDKDERKVLRTLDSELKKVIFGQDMAIDALVDSILISRAGLSNDNKPMGTYLFVGPTGTGKTEVAKQLASKLGLEFLRYDMSEYMEKHTASKLIGAPAGYVGYEEGGLLTEDIRKHPYCVLLLDEFEKAHEDIYNMFLQVMDNAKLTDNQGRTADFRNVIIIMTSNAGASQLGQKTLGFNSVSKDATVMTDSVEKTFSPEFRNRLSGTIIFNSMDSVMAESIAKRQIELLKETLKEKGITLKVSKGVISAITSRVLKPEFGGREIIRIVEKEIKPLFSKPIVFGQLKEGDTCTLTVKNDVFSLK